MSLCRSSLRFTARFAISRLRTAVLTFLIVRLRRGPKGSSRLLRALSPSSSATGGQRHDDAYYDAEFDHECDEEDAALDLRYRQEDRARVSKHGETVRHRLNNLPQSRNRREFNSTNLDGGRDWSW
jgi:hypothetical protein